MAGRVAAVEPNEVSKPVPKMEDTAGEDAKEDAFTENTMREYFAAQPKVTIKTQQDEWVQVNGYVFIVKGGERVEVPKGIAEELEHAGRI